MMNLKLFLSAVFLSFPLCVHAFQLGSGVPSVGLPSQGVNTALLAAPAQLNARSPYLAQGNVLSQPTCEGLQRNDPSGLSSADGGVIVCLDQACTQRALHRQ